MNITFFSVVDQTVLFRKWFNEQTIEEGYPARIFAEVEVEAGCVKAQMSKEWTWSDSFSIGEVSTHIKKVDATSIVSVTSGTLPVGTTITIWGVKA